MGLQKAVDDEPRQRPDAIHRADFLKVLPDEFDPGEITEKLSGIAGPSSASVVSQNPFLVVQALGPPDEKVRAFPTEPVAFDNSGAPHKNEIAFSQIARPCFAVAVPLHEISSLDDGSP